MIHITAITSNEYLLLPISLKKKKINNNSYYSNLILYV